MIVKSRVFVESVLRPHKASYLTLMLLFINSNCLSEGTSCALRVESDRMSVCLSLFKHLFIKSHSHVPNERQHAEQVSRKSGNFLNSQPKKNYYDVISNKNENMLFHFCVKCMDGSSNPESSIQHPDHYDFL